MQENSRKEGTTATKPLMSVMSMFIKAGLEVVGKTGRASCAKEKESIRRLSRKRRRSICLKWSLLGSLEKIALSGEDNLSR